MSLKVIIISFITKSFWGLHLANAALIHIHFTDSGIHLESYISEIMLMKDLHHPNILGLLGVVFDTPDGMPHLVLPFMEHGNLKKFLKTKRGNALNVDKLPEVS